MLAYYVTFHMEQALAPMLLWDHDRDSAEATRPSPVAPAARSASAKEAIKRTTEHDPVHRFKSLLTDLATIAANRIEPTDANVAGFTFVTMPTLIQRRALELPRLWPPGLRGVMPGGSRPENPLVIRLVCHPVGELRPSRRRR